MKENAFLDKDKDSEYGVGTIRAYLNEVGTKADEVFGPIMKGRGREEGLRILLSILEKHGNMLEIPGVLLDCVKRKDYETLNEQYEKARKHLEEARALVPSPQTGIAGGAKEDHIHQLIIAEKMWLEVTYVTDEFKKDTWRRLVDCTTDDNTHTELIGVLLELGVEENPIPFWLRSRHDYLRAKITTLFEKSRVEIEGPQPNPPSWYYSENPVFQFFG